MEVKVYYTISDHFICPICDFISVHDSKNGHLLCDHVADTQAIKHVNGIYENYLWYVMA